MAGSATAIRLRHFVDPSPSIPPGIIHHQGKDVLGYYPGQLARVHIAYPTEAKPRHFTKLWPISPKYEIVPLHEYDHFILKRYLSYQRTKKKSHDWYTQTTYREAFTLPFYKSGSSEDRYRPRTEAELLSVWKSTPAMKRDKVKPSFMGV